MSRDLEWASRVQRLEAEVAGLRRAMSSRAVIEQAKGVLAERMRCAPDEAFAHLSRLSQESNIKLSDIAASVIAAAGGAGVDGADADDSGDRLVGVKPSKTDIIATNGAIPRLASAYAQAYRQAASRVAASADLPELAAALATACGGRVRFMRRDQHNHAIDIASGGHAGPRSTSEARKAISRAAPAWSVAGHGAPGRAAAFPIRSGGRVVGAICFDLDGAARFTLDERRFLAALSQLAQRAAGRVWHVEAHPIAPALDAMFNPAMLLTPVREGDDVVDFVIAYANPSVPDMAGLSRMEQIGQRLLDTYPHLRPSGIFDAYVDVLRTGRPLERASTQETVVLDGAHALIMVRRRAIRHGDSVVATWRRDDERLRRELQLSRMEALGHFGWASWDLIGQKTYWSPGLFAIFGRDEARGPEPLAKLAAICVPADRAAVDSMITEVIARKATSGTPGEPPDGGAAATATIDFHLRDAEGGVRPVRLIVEPVVDSDGAVVRVLAVAQDLTERRRVDEKMSRVQAQLADQRFQLAAQRELASALRQVLYPGNACEIETESARVAGRYAAPDADLPFRGDFCDSTLLATGHIQFAIGDSFGSGAAAGEVVARLLYPARALGAAGARPSTILDVLNRDLHRDALPPLASLVVGRFCPHRSTITWAQGGHLPPVRLRGSASAMIERPAGPALGLRPDASFAEVTFDLNADDLIVWMTDGMVYERAKPTADPWRELRRKLVQARRAGGPDGVLGLCQAADGDEACMLAVLAKAAVGGGDRACPDATCAGR